MKSGPPHQGATSDFKRIKAKVGKRAPKKLNATETSFRSSQVSVRPQQLLSTQKGLVRQERKLLDISHTLASAWVRIHHPAAPVRVSVIETVRDILFSDATLNLNRHDQVPLAILLPPLLKCLVDEDDQVRISAIRLLVDLLADTFDIRTQLQPFVPLILAYISSAFHSLDRDIRYHGCIALHLFLKNHQTLFLSTNLDHYLLAFTTIFADLNVSPKQRLTTTRCDQTHGRKNPKGKISDSIKDCKRNYISSIPFTTHKGIGILQSFNSLLDVVVSQIQQSLADNQTSTMIQRYFPAIHQPQFTFFREQLINGVVCFPDRKSHTVSALSSWTQSTIMLQRSPHRAPLNHSLQLTDKKGTNLIVGPAATQVLEKIHDRLVEVIQKDELEETPWKSSARITISKTGMFLSPNDLDHVSLLFQCIRKVWFCWCRPNEFDDSSRSVVDDFRPTLVVLQRIFSLLTELFPLKSKNHASHQYHTVNASLACLICDLGLYLKPGKEWMDALFSYCIQVLEFHEPGLCVCVRPDDFTDRDVQQVYQEELNSVLDVVKCLLTGKAGLTQKHEQWPLLLTHFTDVFFPLKQNNISLDRMKSNSGLQAVEILTTLLQDEHIPSYNFVLERMMALPLYIKSWGVEYPHESIHILAVLFSIFRRGSISEDPRRNLEKDFLMSMKDALLLLREDCRTEGGITAFDLLPNMSQRLYTSIMSTLDELM